MKSDLLEYLLIFSTLLHLWFILSTLQRRRNAVSPRSPSTVLLRSMGRLLTTTVYPGIFDAETLPEPARGLDGNLYLYPSVSVIILFFFPFQNCAICELNVTKDTCQTPFKHLSNIFQTCFKHPKWFQKAPRTFISSILRHWLRNGPGKAPEASF